MTQNERQNSIRDDKQIAAPRAKKILLAEDDASVRRFLEVVLTRAGYATAAAEDGAIALQKAFETKFDLIVLDAVMPNMSGYEVGRVLRAHPNFKQIPLVILSGLEADNDFDADAHLLKNANMQEELLNAIARLLQSER